MGDASGAGKVEPMARPAGERGSGREGTTVSLDTNFFKLNVKADNKRLYQYAVSMSKDTPKKGWQEGDGDRYDHFVDVHISTKLREINRRIFRRFLAACAGDVQVAYDGRAIAFSMTELPPAAITKMTLPCIMRGEFEGEEPPEGTPEHRVEIFYVKLEPATELDISQVVSGEASGEAADVQPVVNALDVVLSEGNRSRLVEVGRSFYSADGAKDLTGGAQAWRGFYQSVRLCGGGLLVNVDESFTPFWLEGTLLELIKAVGRGQLPNDQAGWNLLGKDLDKLRIKTTHDGRTHTVRGFSPRSAAETTFEDQEGNRISIPEYFQAKYGVALTNTSMPCVSTNKQKGTFFPIELCVVMPKQRCGKGMNPNQTSNMIRHAAIKPTSRKTSSQQAIQQANYNSDPTCQAFGVSVDPNLVAVEARVLPTPELAFGDGRKIRPHNGAWNMTQNRMFGGCQLMYWMVIQVGGYMGEGDVQEFVKKTVEVGHENGFRFLQTQPPIRTLGNVNFEQELTRLIEVEDAEIQKSYPDRYVQLVMVLKPKQDIVIYNAVKKVCDVKLGRASQVLLTEKITKQRKVEQYISNVLLKMNAKMGGQTVKVTSTKPDDVPDVLKRPHILLGADVSHGAPGSKGRPSVASLVGSKDQLCNLFTGAIRNQRSRQEMIEDMGEMFLEVYENWRKSFEYKYKAESIIMFRDGVSEGQYQQVLDVEIPQIRNACVNILKINPKITYVIVTKRHHARFFGNDKTDRSALDSRNSNIVPGTVIDSGITSSKTWEFYFNSHSGIQGTNRPCKYTVLVDENDLTADQLQAYIFRLCHGYARCTRSVSMVNCVYYAHLLAVRGRLYLDDDGSDPGDGGEAVIPPTAQPHERNRLERGLFFL